MADIKARQRAKRMAQERGFGALANDTKWRELLVRLQTRQIPVEVKLLYEEFAFPNGRVWPPAENYIEGHYFGPELVVFIEWVRSQEIEALRLAAAEIGLECGVCYGKAMIYGYR